MHFWDKIWQNVTDSQCSIMMNLKSNYETSSNVNKFDNNVNIFQWKNIIQIDESLSFAKLLY